jgi:hypothetical protein
MPEVGLGIGRGRQVIGGIEQEVLLWYDAQGKPYPMPETLIQDMQEQLVAERQRAEADRRQAQVERQRAERLAAYLRSQGIDPDNLPEL